MSATNDASQSEDSANSLIDRSSAAASTKKRDAPSATSEDDAAPASDAAPAAPSASRDAKRCLVEPDPAGVPALAAIRQRLGAEPADLARPDEAVRLFSQRRGDSTCCYRTLSGAGSSCWTPRGAPRDSNASPPRTSRRARAGSRSWLSARACATRMRFRETSMTRLNLNCASVSFRLIHNVLYSIALW